MLVIVRRFLKWIFIYWGLGVGFWLFIRGLRWGCKGYIRGWEERKWRSCGFVDLGYINVNIRVDFEVYRMEGVMLNLKLRVIIIVFLCMYIMNKVI